MRSLHNANTSARRLTVVRSSALEHLEHADLVSYLPVDVGFDLRLHKEISIDLPRDAHLTVACMRGAEQYIISGPREKVADAMRRAGYQVRR